ncbi:MAG: DNA mismatch repair protein MutS [Firmicutes bacterium]|nr:DNA mismatch repair protein MutS [Bacillota bacterium]
MTEASKLTPMQEQYRRLKRERPDALLLFRLGDFYELFEDDAVTAAPILDVQLTSRDGRVPMCGVPHHAVGQYAQKLLDAGFTVAIAEQMEDPATAKGLVDRQIVRVLTPGTVIPEEAERVPRLGVRYRHRQGWVILAVELSTGRIHIAEASPSRRQEEKLRELWSVWAPQEVLTNDNAPWIGDGVAVDASAFFKRAAARDADQLLAATLGLTNLRRWGLEDREPVKDALRVMAQYLSSLHRHMPRHLQDIRVHRLDGVMHLGSRTLRQLDIVDGPYSLWKRLDLTVTPMGRRRLKEWLESPLTDEVALRRRHEVVEYWVHHELERQRVRGLLKEVGDLSRRLARMVMGLGRPRDVAAIKVALNAFPVVWESFGAGALWSLDDDIDWDGLRTLASALDVFTDPPPARWEDSPLVRPGVDASIDESRRLLENHRQALTALEEQERERSGIKALRVGFHRTFGYYLEVPRSLARDVPADWQRRQTTSHAERFISPSLRDLEAAIESAEARIVAEERRWAEAVQAKVREHAGTLAHIATWLSDVDVLTTFAEGAVRFRWHPPSFQSPEGPIEMVKVRHPVLEGILSDYVTSDLCLSDRHQALIITGPNMGGKSTFMRAIAHNVILAQIGAWVAADAFRVPLFDAVWTRIGADDDLARGQSTFMVEMEDVAAILSQATPLSLVLLDELGRGTSTYDGLAIAEAVVERLTQPEGPLTLFATHYHELTEMEEAYPRIRNYTVEVLEGPQGPIFTHRIIPGRASQSYGIEVAQRAGLPPGVVRRAQHHLKRWETREERGAAARVRAQVTFYEPDPWAGPILDALRALNPDDLSPREAWLWVHDWHRRVTQEAQHESDSPA